MAKNKPKIFIFSDEIYNGEVLVSIGATKEELSLWLEGKFVITEEEMDSVYPEKNTVGRTSLLACGGVAMVIPTNASKGSPVLAHEILHIANFIMERAGVRFTPSSEEAFAYLIEFLTRKINEHL